MTRVTIEFTMYDGTPGTLPPYREPLLLIRKSDPRITNAQLVSRGLFDRNDMINGVDHWRGARLYAEHGPATSGFALPALGDQWALVSDIKIAEAAP